MGVPMMPHSGTPSRRTRAVWQLKWLKKTSVKIEIWIGLPPHRAGDNVSRSGTQVRNSRARNVRPRRRCREPSGEHSSS